MKNIILNILLFPFEVIYQACDFFSYRRKQLGNLLTFGQYCVGGYSGKLKIITQSSLLIYVSEHSHIDNKYLRKMKVYKYWIEDNTLIIKVFTNEKLIKKYQTSLIVLQIKERLKKNKGGKEWH